MIEKKSWGITISSVETIDEQELRRLRQPRSGIPLSQILG
jgi:hypothetical protein